MQIHSNFDAGNIEVISIKSEHVELKIPKDTNSDFLQWFYFKMCRCYSFSGAIGT